jgi:hypothetical protein
MPARRRFDKNGNPIRSLHFIDEDDDAIENVESTSETNESDEEDGQH